MPFPLFILQAKMRLSPVQSIDFGMVARIQKRLPQYLKIAAQDPAWVLMFTFARFATVRRLLQAKARPTTSAVPLGGSPLVEGDASDAAIALNRDGIAQGLRLRPEVVADIRDFITKVPCYAAADARRPVWMPEPYESGAPPGVNGAPIADYRGEILKCPTIVKLWSDPLLLSIAEGYLRRPPILKRSRLWWTFSGDQPDADRLASFSIDHYHYDLDDWLCLKFFFYITDTDAESGPHSFIRGSPARRQLSHQLTAFKAQPLKKLAAFYPAQDFLVLTGPAGYGFAEDPFGFHTGTVPTRRNRLILEVEYGVSTRAVAGPYGGPTP
jgi:hypothetical protein